MTIYASGWVSLPHHWLCKTEYNRSLYHEAVRYTWIWRHCLSPYPWGDRCEECGLRSSHILASLRMLLVTVFPRDIVKTCIRGRQSTGVWVQEFWNSFHDWVHSDPKVKLLLKSLSHSLSPGSSSSSLPTRRAQCTLISVCDSMSIFQLFAATFWGSRV